MGVGKILSSRISLGFASCQLWQSSGEILTHGNEKPWECLSFPFPACLQLSFSFLPPLNKHVLMQILQCAQGVLCEGCPMYSYSKVLGLLPNGLFNRDRKRHLYLSFPIFNYYYPHSFLPLSSIPHFFLPPHLRSPLQC